MKQYFHIAVTEVFFHVFPVARSVSVTGSKV